jgi:hypothetical protein
LDCLALTNDHETDEHGTRTSLLKSTATSDEETCADSAAAESKSVYALVHRYEKRFKVQLRTAYQKLTPQSNEKEGINQVKSFTWRSSACVSLAAFGAAGVYRIR